MVLAFLVSLTIGAAVVLPKNSPRHPMVAPIVPLALAPSLMASMAAANHLRGAHSLEALVRDRTWGAVKSALRSLFETPIAKRGMKRSKKGKANA